MVVGVQLQRRPHVQSSEHARRDARVQLLKRQALRIRGVHSLLDLSRQSLLVALHLLRALLLHSDAQRGDSRVQLVIAELVIILVRCGFGILVVRCFHLDIATAVLGVFAVRCVRSVAATIVLERELNRHEVDQQAVGVDRQVELDRATAYEVSSDKQWANDSESSTLRLSEIVEVHLSIVIAQHREQRGNRSTLQRDTKE